MPKYRKEPYTTEAAKAAGIHCYDDVGVTLPTVGTQRLLILLDLLC